MFKYFNGDSVINVTSLSFLNDERVMINDEYMAEEEDLLRRIRQKDANGIVHTFYEGDVVEANLYEMLGVNGPFLIPVVCTGDTSTLSPLEGGGPDIFDQYSDFKIVGNVFKDKHLFSKMEKIDLMNLEKRFPKLIDDKNQKKSNFKLR